MSLLENPLKYIYSLTCAKDNLHIKTGIYATQKGINEMLDTIVNLEELFIKDRLQSRNQQKKINDFIPIQNK